MTILASGPCHSSYPILGHMSLSPVGFCLLACFFNENKIIATADGNYHHEKFTVESAGE